MAFASFTNATRFHLDSAIMAGVGSYPAAVFLSTHAQEEFGKFFHIDDLLRDLRSGAKTSQQTEAIISKSIFKDHLHKQVYFAMDVTHGSQFESLIAKPFRFSNLRREALFVGPSIKNGKRIVSPAGLNTKVRARKQIQFVNEAMWNLVQSGYYRAHKGVIDEDKVDDILSDHTMTGEFYFVDATVCDEPEPLEESALGFLIKHRRLIKQKDLENTFKLCRIARMSSALSERFRVSIDF